MSKAFTSEETPDEVIAGRAVVRATGEKRPMTRSGYDALLADQTRLSSAPKSPENDHRLALVAATLASVVVVEPPAQPTEVVFGVEVTVEDDDGAAQTWRLVGSDEVDVKKGLVSIDSPLARALVGLKPGDAVEVERPRGQVTLTVKGLRR